MGDFTKVIVLTVCPEHVELAIDIFVDEHEAAPDIMQLEEAARRYPQWTPPATCDRCGERPMFVVCTAEAEEVKPV